MKYILSVSKKRHSIWKIYYKEYDDYEEKWLFKSERINRLLVPYYKLQRCHRTQGMCPECHRVWEPHYQTKTIRRYIDFPAFGLKKEICISCKTSD